VLAFREQKLEALKLQAAIAAQEQEEEEEQLRAAEEKERKRRDMQHKQVRHLTAWLVSNINSLDKIGELVQLLANNRLLKERQVEQINLKRKC